jgi:hypothetical protein
VQLLGYAADSKTSDEEECNLEHLADQIICTLMKHDEVLEFVTELLKLRPLDVDLVRSMNVCGSRSEQIRGLKEALEKECLDIGISNEAQLRAPVPVSHTHTE